MTTINGHPVDTIPVQTKHLDFDSVMPPLRADTPPDVVPDQDPQPAAEPDVDEQDQAPADEDTARRYFHRIRTVAGHKHTRTIVRQGAYVAAGAQAARKRRRDEKTTDRHHRMAAAAEARGDHASALEWESRAQHHRAERHRRRMELLKHAPVHAAQAALTCAVLTTVGLLVLGAILAASQHDAAQVLRPFKDAGAFISTVFDLAALLLTPALALIPLVYVARLWHLGRNRTELPTWLMPERGSTSDMVVITPSVVVVALRDLGYADLRKKIKEMDDGAATLLGPITIAGCGVEVDITLPSGIDTGQIMARRRKFAENLGRHEHEVYITKAPAARTVRVWIADSGALDEPIGASPLVTDTSLRADFVSGRAPWGVDLRGDVVLMALYQRHLLITGLSNQGKTAALRALALWAALDSCVELRIADLKGVGDWGMFDGVATELIEGPGDEHVIRTVHMVEGLVEEMERRNTAVKDSGSENGITPEMARKRGSGFHPIVGIVDEAQVAYMCPVKDEDGKPYGGSKTTSRYFMAVRRIHNQGRAVNVTLWEGTQDPTNENLPKTAREGAHIRAALALGTESQARMALGEAPVDKGAAPHELRMGLDKGKVVAAGDGVPVATGQVSTTVRTHFIDGKDAAAITDRAKSARKPVATRTGEQDDQPDLDVLADVAAVLDGAVRMRKDEAMHLLAERDDRYRTWTDGQMKAALEAAGAPQYTYNGVTHIHGERVREAMARRFSATD